MAGGAKDLDHRYQKVRTQLKREAPPICWLCGQWIDLELKFPNPASWTYDHVVSLADGGDPYDITNGRPAHLSCNSRRGAKQHEAPKGSRRW